MARKIKIFSDSDEGELEKEINSFLEESGGQVIDLKLSVFKPEDDSDKIITVALVVELNN